MGSVPGGFSIAAAALAAAAPLHPAVTIAHTTPTLAVHGTHFRGAEHVRVVLTRDGAKTTRLVRASTQGAFTASLGTLRPFDPCSDAFSILAIGSSGDRATVKFVPRECPPSG